MSSIKDRFGGISGRVRPYILRASDGSIVPAGPACNTVLRSGNRILANILAGNSSFFPTHISFVLSASSGNTGLEAIEANKGYDTLVDGGSLVLLSHLLTPSVKQGNDGACTVTFMSHTGIHEPVDANTTVAGYVTRALLVSRNNGVNIPFSAIDFSSPVEVPSNGSVHFGVYWDILFSAGVPAQEG
jgi:hypothetical protein